MSVAVDLNQSQCVDWILPRSRLNLMIAKSTGKESTYCTVLLLLLTLTSKDRESTRNQNHART